MVFIEDGMFRLLLLHLTKMLVHQSKKKKKKNEVLWLCQNDSYQRRRQNPVGRI